MREGGSGERGVDRGASGFERGGAEEKGEGMGVVEV